MTFASPGRLWLLAVVGALVVAHVLLQRRRSRYAVRLPGLALLASVAPRLGWRRHAAAAGLVLAMTGATAAFAEPRAEVEVPRERATVVVALDVSLSMAATDVDPDRFTAAKAAAGAFVDGLPDRFDVALVAFSGTASITVAPTRDHAAVTAAIDGLELGNGTAIGEAVASSLTAVAGARTDVPAHVVLLSDGASTAGRPVAAAVEDAVAAGVPVSTIAYGTQEGEVQVERRRIRVPVDAPALAELAAATGGTAYEAASGDELQDVYDDVATTVGTTTESREVSAGVAGLALMSTLGAGAAALAWSPRSL